MNTSRVSAILGLLLLAQHAMADTASTGLPVQVTGIASIAAASLIIGFQLSKRRK